MKYKTRESLKEVRLWITQIIVPVASVACTSLTIPEVRQVVAAKANQIKSRIEEKKVDRNRRHMHVVKNAPK